MSEGPTLTILEAQREASDHKGKVEAMRRFLEGVDQKGRVVQSIAMVVAYEGGNIGYAQDSYNPWPLIGALELLKAELLKEEMER